MNCVKGTRYLQRKQHRGHQKYCKLFCRWFSLQHLPLDFISHIQATLQGRVWLFCCSYNLYYFWRDTSAVSWCDSVCWTSAVGKREISQSDFMQHKKAFLFLTKLQAFFAAELPLHKPLLFYQSNLIFSSTFCSTSNIYSTCFFKYFWPIGSDREDSSSFLTSHSLPSSLIRCNMTNFTFLLLLLWTLSKFVYVWFSRTINLFKLFLGIRLKCLFSSG